MEGQIQIYLIILLKDFESALHYDHDNKETSVADFSTVRVVEKIIVTGCYVPSCSFTCPNHVLFAVCAFLGTPVLFP